MKKVFLAVVLTTLLVCNADAQNSDVEIAMQETKAEMFLKNCSFVRTDQVATFTSKKGAIIYAKIFTDIESGEKIGALEFIGRGAFLGYLDMDRVSDLITALEHTMEVSKNSSKLDDIEIDYTAPGGINFRYDSHATGYFSPKPGLSFRKKWYSVNEYGVQTVTYSKAAYIKMKHVAKLLPIIKEAQITIEQKLEKKEEKISNINHQEINTTNIQPAQPMASAEEIQKYEQVHKQIETLINRAFLSGQFQYKKVSDVYKKLYNVLPLTEENLIKIQKIQTIVIEYFKSETNTFPLLQKQLQNASSMEEEIQIFLSYYQE